METMPTSSPSAQEATSGLAQATTPNHRACSQPISSATVRIQAPARPLPGGHLGTSKKCTITGMARARSRTVPGGTAGAPHLTMMAPRQTRTVRRLPAMEEGTDLLSMLHGVLRRPAKWWMRSGPRMHLLLA